ncbi:MAG: terminase small subunit [Acidobacteriaceae bacterium]|nr:terminase small subunit [Acidobacteriaceae bacterium]
MSSSAALIRQLKEDTVVRYPRRVEEALGELNPRQRRFALLYASGEPAYKSYAAAYDCAYDDSAHANSSRLLQSDNVRLAVREIEKWVESRMIADPGYAAEYCYQRWIAAAESDKTPDVLRATELIAKAAGLFVSRSEVTHRHILELDQADAQLKALMADLGVADTIDAMFHVEHSVEHSQVIENKGLLTPSIGVRGECCPMCGRPIEEDGRA